MHFALVSLVLALRAVARTTIVDNLSSRVVFSPPPCPGDDVAECSSLWKIHNSKHALGGSVTQTTGGNSSDTLYILPRALLTFQGTEILFHPGNYSTAQATVSVDGGEQVLLDTRTAFKRTGLDPLQNHTIAIAFSPKGEDTMLAVDFFEVTELDEGTSTSSSPASPSPTSSPDSSSTGSSTAASQPAVPIGTIAAVSLSGAIVLALGLLVCFCAARRRRRQDAVTRERAILYDLQLPSERDGPFAPYRGTREKVMQIDTYRGMMLDKKQKTDPPELEWRIASPPPASVHMGRKYNANYSLWP